MCWWNLDSQEPKKGTPFSPMTYSQSLQPILLASTLAFSLLYKLNEGRVGRVREQGVLLKNWFLEMGAWFKKNQPLLSQTPLKRAVRLYHQQEGGYSPVLLQEAKNQLALPLTISERESWETLQALMELHPLIEGSHRSAKACLQEAFIPRFGRLLRKEDGASGIEMSEVSVAEIAESATEVGRLLWKISSAAQTPDNAFQKPAQQVFETLTGKKFDPRQSPLWFEALIKAIQLEGGIPFLVLNLVQQARWHEVKPFAKKLLLSEIEIEEETRACLYWISEIHWFTRKAITVADFETTVRYLYHLCFTNPERAGFLEIDSQFFSQFETVNELAKEGFLFKETLIERVFLLWENQGPIFDGVFKETLQNLTRQKSKIYEDRLSWQKWWLREKEDFDKEYLFLIESNLSYVARDFKSAEEYLKKALAVSPHLRPALLNQLFCLAQLKNDREHDRTVEELLSMKSLYPSVLSVVGNSYFLLGKDSEAKEIYEALAQVEGWGKKTAYYQSTFCFENGLWEKALVFAEEAHQQNPEDMSVRFHLSQCLNAVGRKGEALSILRKMQGVGPQWLNFYRFTLERDSGQWREALQTLSEIPTEYFDDPEELEAALEFAKNSSDLNLLRRLKSRQ